MFWWGRVNSIIAIAAFGGSFLCIISGAWGALLSLWVLIILLRVALIICNVLHVAVTGRPLFYDTQLLWEQAQDQRSEEVVDDE